MKHLLSPNSLTEGYIWLVCSKLSLRPKLLILSVIAFITSIELLHYSRALYWWSEYLSSLPPGHDWQPGIYVLWCSSTWTLSTLNNLWSCSPASQRLGTMLWRDVLWSVRRKPPAVYCWEMRRLEPTSSCTSVRGGMRHCCSFSSWSIMKWKIQIVRQILL